MCRARTPRWLLGQYELCTARECKVHAETNLAPECLRMDGIAPLLLSASFYAAPFRRRLMHVRTSCTQRYSRASTKYSVPRRRQTRAQVNVPRGSLVSFSYPLTAPHSHRSPSYSELSSLFLALSSCHIPSFGIFLLSPLTVHYSSHSL